MNKKAYITPAMEAIKIDTVEMITASANPNISIDRQSAGGDEMLSNDRRGTWGDLWN